MLGRPFPKFFKPSIVFIVIVPPVYNIKDQTKDNNIQTQQEKPIMFITILQEMMND